MSASNPSKGVRRMWRGIRKASLLLPCTRTMSSSASSPWQMLNRHILHSGTVCILQLLEVLDHRAHDGSTTSAQHLADGPEWPLRVRDGGQPLLGFCRRPTCRQ